jgi:hypothetical protein
MKKWMKNIFPFLIKEEIYIEFRINGVVNFFTKGRDNENLQIFIANAIIIHLKLFPHVNLINHMTF